MLLSRSRKLKEEESRNTLTEFLVLFTQKARASGALSAISLFLVLLRTSLTATMLICLSKTAL